MNYKTLNETITSEFIERKSRFICILTPLKQNGDVEEMLAYARRTYVGATHYCYAFIMRDGGNIVERYSDDGEPSATAGLPILNVLKQRQLEGIVAVVVRYFGGTLLGTGGLVRAYTRSVQLALDEVVPITMEYSQRLKITLDYNYYGSFENQWIRLLNQVVDIQYSERVKVDAWLSSDKIAGFTVSLQNLTGGKVNIEYLEEGYVPQRQ